MEGATKKASHSDHQHRPYSPRHDVSEHPVLLDFPAPRRMLLIGVGAIGSGLLPLIFRHINVSADRILAISAGGEKERARCEVCGLTCDGVNAFTRCVWGSQCQIVGIRSGMETRRAVGSQL
jgi:hypothetical protein